MEEYHDLLKSTEAWIENTSRLLANPADYASSKMLSQHASTLQVGVLSLFPAYGMYTTMSGIAPLPGAFPCSPEERPYLQSSQPAGRSLGQRQALERDFGDWDLVLSVLITPM